MNLKINFRNLVRQMLPGHKRQPGRLFLFRMLISPLGGLFVGFEKWRDDIRIQINMTGQVGVLQGYLRAKYNSEAIRIDNYSATGRSVGLRVEGVTHSVPVGLGLAGETPIAVPLRGEIELQFDDADFVVRVPASFSDRTIDDIRRDVDRYKQALVKFKITK